MTTVAANRKCMAADTKVTDEGSLYYTTKIFVVERSIVGVAGDVSRTCKFLAWMRQGQPKDASTVLDGDDPDFQALVLNRNGLFLYTDTCEPDKLHDPHFAIGSGCTAALAVMARPINYDPKRAVAHAARIDPYTGGKIEVLWVKDL